MVVVVLHIGLAGRVEAAGGKSPQLDRRLAEVRRDHLLSLTDDLRNTRQRSCDIDDIFRFFVYRFYPVVVAVLLKIPELQNPSTGLNFQGTGKVGTPLGAQAHRTGAVSDGMIIGLDNRYALEQVRVGDVLVEYDKLIDRQLERAVISTICGFGKICTDAAAVLNV